MRNLAYNILKITVHIKYRDTNFENYPLTKLHKSLITITRKLCLYNLIFQINTPNFQMVNWTALVSCGYVLIRSMNNKFIEEFPAILTYPFGVVICVCCSYGMLQISAEMFDIATSFLNSWSETKHQNLRRIMTSCATLRIQVGQFYFVTVSTTVTYFQKTFDYIIDCIVTFPQNM